MWTEPGESCLLNYPNMKERRDVEYSMHIITHIWICREYVYCEVQEDRLWMQAMILRGFFYWVSRMVCRDWVEGGSCSREGSDQTSLTAPDCTREEMGRYLRTQRVSGSRSSGSLSSSLWSGGWQSGWQSGWWSTCIFRVQNVWEKYNPDEFAHGVHMHIVLQDKGHYSQCMFSQYNSQYNLTMHFIL